MSIHISAKPGEIAPVVLMPGDPLRAKYIAENMLDNFILVSSTRNILFYTGNYKGIPVTVGASGMGCPSIGIYSFELYQDYGVEAIIRIGTAGAYSTQLNLYDLINVASAYSESSYASAAFGFPENCMTPQGKAFDIINDTALASDRALVKAHIHSSDVFYRKDHNTPAIAVENNCVAVEMEAFALFANARYLNKMAACLLTISDVIPTKAFISADQRERSLAPMIDLALDSVVSIHQKIAF